jgi:single-strand DNA-binding protein
MSNYNKVILIGNLTRDPELKYTQSGMAVVEIGLAVNRKYRNRNTNEMVEETTFVDIEGWGKQAEVFHQYMSKGRPVFIEGRLRLDRWETQDGQKRSKLCVVMENFQFLGGGGEASARGPRRESRPVNVSEGSPRGQSVQSQGGGNRGAEDYDFDDIPF